MRAGRWKLLHDPRDTSERPNPPKNAPEDVTFLVDLEADPGETTNVAAEHPDVVARLTGLHEAWVAGGY